MQTIYFTSESERRAVLPDAAEDEAWRERTRLEMPDDNPGNFAPVCDRIHLKASQQSKVPGPGADFIFAAISPCFVKISAERLRQIGTRAPCVRSHAGRMTLPDAWEVL